MLYSPNFGWQNAPLGETLRKRFSLPVYVANDARCATLGEYTFGIGKKTKDFVLLTLGTGIGGGIVADGDLMLGNRWGAGEIGHHQIRPTDGFVCACGKIGCFEAQASGTGLIRHAFAGRTVVSAQYAARRRARQTQLEEDSQSGASRRRSRPRRMEEFIATI